MNVISKTQQEAFLPICSRINLIEENSLGIFCLFDYFGVTTSFKLILYCLSAISSTETKVQNDSYNSMPIYCICSVLQR